MATDTSTHKTADESKNDRQRYINLLRPVAVTGAATSIIVQYALFVLVLNETIGPAIEQAPVLVRASSAAAIAIPMISTPAMLGLYLYDLVAEPRVRWGHNLMLSLSFATLLSAIWSVVEYAL